MEKPVGVAGASMLGTKLIVEARGSRNSLDAFRPYHFLVEKEFSRHECVQDVATIFLTNRECPFHCLMCDLWKNTLEHVTPPMAIPAQIDYALERLPVTPHVKLYNSGNFFDPKAIPRADWWAIAQRVRRFETVIVENHPLLCSDPCGEFQSLCETQLEVAMGLETSHAETLALLNKQMTVGDFAHACEVLLRQKIMIRAFILLKPPDTSEEQGIERAIESVRFAFDCGVNCCAVIPVRSGNGIMDQLIASGRFFPPRLSSLETVVRETLSWRRGRVFADLWDASRFADSSESAAEQIARLERMNLTQRFTTQS